MTNIPETPSKPKRHPMERWSEGGFHTLYHARCKTCEWTCTSAWKSDVDQRARDHRKEAEA